MRGRRPSGPEYVDHLDGSAQAKERLKVVLETLAGTCRVQEACQRLGVSEPRFHQLRAQVLEAALARLEPRPAGRPPQPPAPEQQHLQELAARAVAEDLAVRTAQAREEIALTLPRVVHEPPGPEKKTRPAKRRRRGTKRRT
jgi:transposase